MKFRICWKLRLRSRKNNKLDYEKKVAIRYVKNGFPLSLDICPGVFFATESNISPTKGRLR